MSTVIQSSQRGAPAVTLTRVLPRFGDAVSVLVADTTTPVPLADFLAAVAAECNVIIIDKADLPDVATDRDDNVVAGLSMMESDRRTPSLARHMALGYLAIAEYLDANPPVDETQVEALSHGLFDAHGTDGRHYAADPREYHAMARTLIAQGWKKP